MGARILVVDDEPVLAFSLAATLTSAGFEVVGPVGSVAQALAVIEREGCDGAILDVALRDGTSEPVARVLHELGKPYLVLTGAVERLPAGLAGAPTLAKPVRTEALMAEIRVRFGAVAP